MLYFLIKYFNRFNNDEDKYLLCLLFKYGYRNWNCIKNHMMYDPHMKFNFNIKTKTDQELLDRSNYLISCFKLDKKKKNTNISSKVEVKKINNVRSKSNKKLSKKKKKKVRRRD